jgi:hypothetical protein
LRETLSLSVFPQASGGNLNPRPPCRLHLLKATAAPVACVIRRGPSNWFHVALWRHEEGVVDHGAWTKIKLYPERCGLSPDGTRLVVFALGGEWGAYFAVSKAPWLHALAAWSTVGTWTTGADIEADGTLVLAGCAGDAPFHGEYPGSVTCLPIDTHWVRARLFRELRTGWAPVALRQGGRELLEPSPWTADLPAPLSAHPDSVVAVKPNPRSADRVLVVVSLYERHREYYLLDGADLTGLEDVVFAEWDAAGKLLVATRSGKLRVLDPSLTTRWEYDMDSAEAAPTPAPAWSRAW